VPAREEDSSFQRTLGREGTYNMESARVQLCGTFAVELLGRRVDNLLPGRQGRLLFAYLVVLGCCQSLETA